MIRPNSVSVLDAPFCHAAYVAETLKRREFLKGGAVGLAAAALATPTVAQSTAALHTGIDQIVSVPAFAAA